MAILLLPIYSHEVDIILLQVTRRGTNAVVLRLVRQLPHKTRPWTDCFSSLSHLNLDFGDCFLRPWRGGHGGKLQPSSMCRKTCQFFRKNLFVRSRALFNVDQTSCLHIDERRDELDSSSSSVYQRLTIMFGYILAAVAAFSLLSYFVLWPVVEYFRDPKGLRKYPSLNFLSGITDLSFTYEAQKGFRSQALLEAHKKSPVVRIGPNSLSYSDLSAIKVR